MMESLRTLSEDQFYRDGHLLVDFYRKTATLDNHVLTLTHKEYCVLELLVRHAGRIVTRDMLRKRIWGSEAATQTRSLDVHIRQLRKKLGDYGRPYIQTIFGAGHRFESSVNLHEEAVVELPDLDRSGPGCLAKNLRFPGSIGNSSIHSQAVLRRPFAFSWKRRKRHKQAAKGGLKPHRALAKKQGESPTTSF